MTVKEPRLPVSVKRPPQKVKENAPTLKKFLKKNLNISYNKEKKNHQKENEKSIVAISRPLLKGNKKKLIFGLATVRRQL